MLNQVARRRKGQQLEFNDVPRWGGRRAGAGRKKLHKGAINHDRREEFSDRHPLHVTVRLLPGLPSMQRKRSYFGIFECLQKGCLREGFRVTHWSIQRNHLHLIVEASGKRGLARGMQGLLIRIAKRLNKLWKRRGRVFGDRYHHRVVKTAREVRNLICYVLHNSRRHGSRAEGPCVWSSAFWFDGWLEATEVRGLADPDPPIAKARTALLGWVWKRLGLISVRRIPRPTRMAQEASPSRPPLPRLARVAARLAHRPRDRGLGASH